MDARPDILSKLLALSLDDTSNAIRQHDIIRATRRNPLDLILTPMLRPFKTSGTVQIGDIEWSTDEVTIPELIAQWPHMAAYDDHTMVQELSEMAGVLRLSLQPHSTRFKIMANNSAITGGLNALSRNVPAAEIRVHSDGLMIDRKWIDNVCGLMDVYYCEHPSIPDRTISRAITVTEYPSTCVELGDGSQVVFIHSSDTISKSLKQRFEGQWVHANGLLTREAKRRHRYEYSTLSKITPANSDESRQFNDEQEDFSKHIDVINQIINIGHEKLCI